MAEQRVKAKDVEAAIASEHYFTAAQGDKQAQEDAHEGCAVQRVEGPLHTTTICMLVLRNGHAVHGVSYCANPDYYCEGTGQMLAREAAIKEAWPLLVYAMKDRIATEGSTK